MDACADPSVNEVVVMSCSQVGKTETLLKGDLPIALYRKMRRDFSRKKVIDVKEDELVILED